MSMSLSDLPLQVPGDWTPQEALIVYEHLTRMAEAVWDRYEVELLPLVHADPRTPDSLQLDLLDPDDELPF
jgi:hypothetical protein